MAEHGYFVRGAPVPWNNIFKALGHIHKPQNCRLIKSLAWPNLNRRVYKEGILSVMKDSSCRGIGSR